MTTRHNPRAIIPRHLNPGPVIEVRTSPISGLRIHTANYQRELLPRLRQARAEKATSCDI